MMIVTISNFDKPPTALGQEYSYEARMLQAVVPVKNVLVTFAFGPGVGAGFLLSSSLIILSVLSLLLFTAF